MLNAQILEKKMELIERMLTSGDPSEPNYFEFLKFETFDPFFSTIIT